MWFAKILKNLVIVFLFGLFSMPAFGTIVNLASGTSSVGNPVSFKAELTITGDLLTIELFNLSPQTSAAPDDLLCSYFFDIKSSSSRPQLTYVSAVGDVYLTSKNATDTLQTAGANIKAINGGDSTWQFRTLNAALNPFLAFGIGTVGNNNLSPNNFNGNITGGMDYGIYTGDVTTQNLNNRLFVKDTATCTFSGLTGFSEADISPVVVFGMGTAPDSLLTNPEPATISLLGFGLTLLLRKHA